MDTIEYIHYQVKALPYNDIIVRLDAKADVLVLNKINYHRFKKAKPYSHTLEFKDTEKADLKVPYKGEWHIIVLHGRYKGRLKARVDVL